LDISLFLLNLEAFAFSPLLPVFSSRLIIQKKKVKKTGVNREITGLNGATQKHAPHPFPPFKSSLGFNFIKDELPSANYDST
jgi:hypothetical protein